VSECYRHILETMLTRRKENMMHPTKSHFPTLKGMLTQPIEAQLLKISFDHDVVVNMVMAVKISET
jgi:hypothetical protein